MWQIVQEINSRLTEFHIITYIIFPIVLKFGTAREAPLNAIDQHMQ